MHQLPELTGATRLRTAASLIAKIMRNNEENRAAFAHSN